MTTVTERTGIWKNSDGMRVAFGLEQTEQARVGSPAQSGSLKVLEVDLVFGDLPAFGSTTAFVNNTPTACVPAGALLKSAILTTVVAFDSAADAMTMDLGMAKQDGTDIDIDGIDAAVAQAAIDAEGESVTCDGALIGTIMAFDSYPSVRLNTATATAGKAKLILTYLPVADLTA